MAISVETLALAKKFAKSYTDSATEGLSGGVKYKGAVNYYDLLPASPKLGDAYTVVYKGTSQEAEQVSDGSEYVWGKIDNVAQWILFGASVPDIPEPTSVDNGKTLGVENGAYALVAGSGGDNYYSHSILIYSNNGYARASCTIINKSSVPFTFTSMKQYMSAHQGSMHCLSAVGLYLSDSKVFTIVGLTGSSDGTSVYAVILDSTMRFGEVSAGFNNLSDTVVQIS